MGGLGGQCVCPSCVGTARVPRVQELGGGGAEKDSQVPAAKWLGVFGSLAKCSSFFSMTRNDYCHQNIMGKKIKQKTPDILE